MSISGVEVGFGLNFNKRGFIKTESRRKSGYIKKKLTLVNIGEMALSKEKVARERNSGDLP